MSLRSMVWTTLLMSLAQLSLAQQATTFSHESFTSPANASKIVAVDLNNDHATDVVTDGPNPSIYVQLSNGSGAFGVPREFPAGFFPRGIAAGDLDGDGKADVVITAFDNVHGAFQGVEIFFGNGDGTLSAPVKLSSPGLVPNEVAIADFNGDGKKDILVTGSTPSGDYRAFLFTNTGNRTFSFGGGLLIDNDAFCCDTSSLQVGDFDGDSHADFFIQRNHQANGPNTTIDLHLFYGDGKGFFQPGPATSLTGSLSLTSTDLNSDGKSDIVGILNFDGQDARAIAYYGNATRQLTQTTLASFADFGTAVAAGDFNGDGLIDLAFFGSDANGGGTWFLLQTPSQTFTLQKTGYPVFPNVVGDFNRDKRLDIAQRNPASQNLEVLLNTTTGNFSHWCNAPVNGIKICAPGTTVLSSTTQFKISASAFTPLRKVELWIDGSKKAESFYSYFDYAFMTTGLALARGTHKADIFAAGYDNTLAHKSLTFTVGCSQPSSAGVHVCSPVNGSSVSSPVHAVASGRVTGTFARMELWVDGHKTFSSSSTTLDTFVGLSSGSHRFDFFAINTAGQKWQATVSANVK